MDDTHPLVGVELRDVFKQAATIDVLFTNTQASSRCHKPGLSMAHSDDVILQELLLVCNDLASKLAGDLRAHLNKAQSAEP